MRSAADMTRALAAIAPGEALMLDVTDQSGPRRVQPSQAGSPRRSAPDTGGVVQDRVGGSISVRPPCPNRPPRARSRSSRHRVAELELRVVQLTALHRVALSIAKSPSPSRVFVELARELGAAIPRVYEVSVASWDRRRGLIRDIFEFKPQENRRVAVPGSEFDLRGLPELDALLRAGRGSLVSLRDDPATPASQVAYMKRFGWRSLLQAPLAAAGRTLAVIEIADIAESRPWQEHEIEFCETLALAGSHDPAAGASSSSGSTTWPSTTPSPASPTRASSTAAPPRPNAPRAGTSSRSACSSSTSTTSSRSTTSAGTRTAIASSARPPRCCASTPVRSDVAGRLGGDELALLLPRTQPGDVRMVAKRLARALREAGIPVSIGLATIPGSEAGGPGLVEAADLALLQAKRQGKGRIARAA